MNNKDRQSRIDDEIDITKQELDNIGEALKNEQFRKLLCEYVDEINDPENRAQYEREVEQYERERGVEVTFVRPQPGYVVKTSSNGVRKVFINICSCDVIQKPSSRVVSTGDHWSLPHCLSPLRQDYDKAYKICDVYDVVFHPDVLKLVMHGKKLKDMVEDTALSVIEKNNNVILDKTNLKYPKISFKGISRSLAIRKKIKDFKHSTEFQSTDIPGCPYEPPVERPVQHYDLGTLNQKSLYTVPKYTIKYRSDIDIQEHGYNMHCKMNAVIPKELIVEINLPLLDSSANVELDVLPKSLKLVCHKPSKYKLEINLPYNVLEDEGNATFDKSTKKLIVSLPVLRKEPSIEYTKHLVSEVDTLEDQISENDHNVDIINDHHLENCNDQKNKSMNDKDNIIHHNEHTNENNNDIEYNSKSNENVHYTLPKHEFIFGNKCILTLNVKNVDPTTINVIVINEHNLISGKFYSIGSGFFPIWFAFCIQIPSKSSLLKSDIKVLPSDNDVVLEFDVNFKPDCKQYWYGLDQDNLAIQYIEMDMHKENSKDLANGVLVSLNDSDDDDDDDDDDDVDDNVFYNSKEEIELKDPKQLKTKKNGDSCQSKDKNNKTIRAKNKKGKKIQKSNAIPIVTTGSLPESGKKVDFIPGSLPTNFNNIRPAIRGILKKRALSECSSDDIVLSPKIYSSTVDNVDTESSDLLESSSNDLNSKKTVRFNDHVIEKKINFNISIAAQAKKHRQRQQRKRNIREYNTPSESEASEAEDKIYGPVNLVSESEETSISESSAGEMSDDNCSSSMKVSKKVTIVSDSKKDHKRRKSKSARKNASLAKQASTNNLIFPIEY